MGDLRTFRSMGCTYKPAVIWGRVRLCCLVAYQLGDTRSLVLVQEVSHAFPDGSARSLHFSSGRRSTCIPSCLLRLSPSLTSLPRRCIFGNAKIRYCSGVHQRRMRASSPRCLFRELEQVDLQACSVSKRVLARTSRPGLLLSGVYSACP